MRSLLIVYIISCIYGCSSVSLVNTWKNPEVNSYKPIKILVVGLTPNQNVREKFESLLKREFEQRHTAAEMSSVYFKNDMTTEDALNAIEYQLLKDGFDVILFTKTIGVENKIAYKQNFDSDNETMIRFKEDYLKYQDIYYNPDYYQEYQVYHAETAMYCICPTKDRELIWKGYIDIVDPQDISTSVMDYVKLVIAALEAEQLVTPLNKSKTN